MALKLLVSVAALGFAFHDTDFPSLARVGLSADWVLLLAAVLLTVASVGALSVRWREILAPLVSAPASLLMRAHYIGLFGNNVFPLRAGEFMRADYIRRKVDEGLITILGTIFIERALDLLVVGVIFGGLVITASMPGVSTIHRWALVGAFLALPIAIASLVHHREKVAAVVRRRFPGAPQSQRLIRALLTYRAIRNLILTSTLVWALYSLRFQAVLSSIGIPPDAILVALLLVATAAGFLIPAAPGALGTYHAAVVFSMHDIYGLELIDAQAAAILLHLSAYLPSTLVGFVVYLTASEGRHEAADDA